MFTGLIEDLGVVEQVRPAGTGLALTITTALPLDEVRIGDSIAVNGACLTAESFGAKTFTAIAARETMERTALKGLRRGVRVHLERAMTLGARLDGHLVQGHVDGVGEVSSLSTQRESLVLWVRCPGTLLRYVAPKGSIAIQGVSLTVNELLEGAFRVNLVPHTARQTLLGDLRPGAQVNLEVDVIAKYVERLLSYGAGPRREG